MEGALHLTPGPSPLKRGEVRISCRYHSRTTTFIRLLIHSPQASESTDREGLLLRQPKAAASATEVPDAIEQSTSGLSDPIQQPWSHHRSPQATDGETRFVLWLCSPQATTAITQKRTWCVQRYANRTVVCCRRFGRVHRDAVTHWRARGEVARDSARLPNMAQCGTVQALCGVCDERQQDAVMAPPNQQTDGNPR